MTMKVYKRREISYENRLEIIFSKNNDKSYGEIAIIVGCSKSAAFVLCKKLHKSRTVRNLPRGRPRRLCVTIF